MRRWDDARGYGFVEPDLGGRLVFVHFKAFSFELPERPQVGQRISYELAPDRQGGERASRAVIEPQGGVPSTPPRVPSRQAPQQPLGQDRPTRAVPRRASQPPEWGVATLFWVPLAVLGYAVAARLWSVPKEAGYALLALNAMSLLFYAQDKAAARARRWRTPESTLHLIALLGGWPGALVAQQISRHKTRKASFRSVFWLTAVLNVTGFVLLFSPLRGLIA